MMEDVDKFIKFMRDNNNVIKLSDPCKENIYKNVVNKLVEFGFETIAYDHRNIYTLFDMRSKDIFVRINPYNHAWPISIYGPYVKNFVIYPNKNWDIKVFKILESLGVKNDYI